MNAHYTIGIDASRSTIEQPTGTELYSRLLIDALLEQAAANRLRVAVSTLRARGLRDVIVTTATGYAIAPWVRLAV